MARTTGSDELYRLIHSLTTEEKGYFKKFARRHTSKGNNYLQLFDAINKQTEFEEAGLKKKFKNYAVMKVYLFEMILQSLMLYRQKNDKEMALIQQMIYCSILQSKGLANRATRLNDEAMKTAREHELFWLEERFLRTTLSYEEHTWKPAERFEKYRNVYDGIKHIRNKQDNKDQYGYLTNVIINYEQERHFLQKENPEFDKLVNLDFLTDKNRALSHGSNRTRLFALGRYYHTMRNYAMAHKFSSESFKLEEKLFKTKHPLYNTHNYTSALHSHILLTFGVNEYKSIPGLLSLALKHQYYEKKEEISAYYFYCRCSLIYFWRTGKHAEGEKFYDSIRPALTKHLEENKKYIPLLTLASFKILFAFSAKNYSKAMLGISEICGMDIKNSTPEIFKVTAWLQLLMHLKTEDYSLVQSSVSQLMKGKNISLLPVEKEILALLKTISSFNKKQVIHKALDLYNNASQPVYFFENIDLKSGLEYLLTDKPLQEVIRTYFEKH